MATATRTVNYLLVEDNDEHAQIIDRTLRCERISTEFRRVKTGTECLAYLAGEGPFADRDLYPYPDVVLLDVRLPGLFDGFQTLRSIRGDTNHASLSVIILTTSDRDVDMSQAYRLGANGYIVKSENPGDMIEKFLSLHLSFETWAQLPAHKSPPPEQCPTAAPSNTLRSHASREEQEASALAGRKEEAYHSLQRAYRNDRNEALQLLKDLERNSGIRFAALAQRFCAEQKDLIAGGEDVDWALLREIVMDRLPRHIAFDRMAALVIGITAVLDSNCSARHDIASWQTWQGFCRAYLNQDTTLPPGFSEEIPESLPRRSNRWATVAIIAIVLSCLLVLGFFAREFL